MILLRLTAIEYQLGAQTNVGTDHEARIRVVEKWAWGIPASLLGAAVSLVIAFKG